MLFELIDEYEIDLFDVIKIDLFIGGFFDYKFFVYIYLYFSFNVLNL